MNRYISYLSSLSLLLAIACFTGCSKQAEKEDPEPEVETFEITGVVLPSDETVTAGDEVTFKCLGKLPVSGDVLQLISESDVRTDCPIIDITTNSFSFIVPEDLTTGSYTVYVCRGDKSIKLGTVNFEVQIDMDVDVIGDETIYGVVICDGQVMQGIEVSDGDEVVTTDDNGIYRIKSAKKNGYVFITIPSGYRVASDGVFPKFYKYLNSTATTPERADFELVKDSKDQTKHTMLFIGDLHLAKRTNDIQQFTAFTSDFNKYVEDHSDENLFAQTLGDMTWDLYWYSQSYALSEYVSEINNRVSGIQMFHCIGNHDHEMGSAETGYPAGDFETVVKYKKIIGPTWFSYNIGKIHYIVLDNIYCTNPGTGSRTYGTPSSSNSHQGYITDEQMDWLGKDLSYVSKSTPVVIIFHAPAFTAGNNVSMDSNNYVALSAKLSGYTTYIISGHTHRQYNTDKLSSDGIFELNSGSVCATWWWTGYYSSGLYLARDGSNGGYRIFEVDGTDVKWQYKSTGKDADVQFRTYDGNQIQITGEKYVPKYSDKWASFESDASSWASPSSDNYVYIEVWDYDPAWKVQATENGKELNCERITIKDPLHLIAYNAKRYSAGASTEPTSEFATTTTPQMFRCKASSATSTIEITVTDRFGRVYTESMTRPKEFSIENYTK